MIDSTHGLECGDLFTTHGGDLWEVSSFCALPTVGLENFSTGEKRGGAVGCLNVENFVPLSAKRAAYLAMYRALIDAKDSLEYVNRVHPEASGSLNRSERIKLIDRALEIADRVKWEPLGK